MTKNLPAASSTLWPPENPAALKLIEAVATPDLDERGNSMLRRSLTAVEKQVLTNRSAELAPFVARARSRDAEESVLAMLIGFGGRQSEDESDMTAGQFASVCCNYGLPLWAIQRACLRFSAGDVTAEEVGERRLGHSYCPTSAHLRILATRIAHPVHREVHRIGMALRGTVAAPPQTEEQRRVTMPKIKAMQDDYHRKAAAIGVDHIAEEEQRREAVRRASAASTQRQQLAEYERAGVEPVYLDAGKTLLVSFGMLRRRGFEVRDLGQGERALVGPAGERP